MTVAIKAEGLSKRYIIRHDVDVQYETLRDVIAQKSKRIITALTPKAEVEETRVKVSEEFWALDDLDFEIEQGAKVGIIGRNGAGKSTLLKVLSRITEPTRGRVSINGRIASLLEVGTGFHPELTGRENIFLNGAILGMTRTEIRSKFDAIVDYADVEKFLDTPVKRYSSGMYVRLAFAVAAHLEPEILVVDEVLAVGDAIFQKKCLNTMSDASSNGATVVFVSHNMAAINSLCNKAMYLEAGKVVDYNDVGSVVSNYLSNVLMQVGCEYKNTDDQDGKKACLLEASIMGPDDTIAHTLLVDKQSSIRLLWKLNVDVKNLRVGIEISNSMGVIVLSTMDTDSTDWHDTPRSSGFYDEVLRLPAYALMPGLYSVKVFAGTPRVERYMEKEDVLQFNVSDNNTHLSHVPDETRMGYHAKPIHWDITFCEK